jgi:CRISPR-associated protein Cas1
MRSRRQSKGGRNTRSKGDTGGDLFSQELNAAVKQAFAAEIGTTGASQVVPSSQPPVTDRADLVEAPTPVTIDEVPESKAPAPHSQLPSPSPVAPRPSGTGTSIDPLPARMLNEFVYCRRLFYYEHVEGVFVESADTVKGSTVHKRVDKGRGALPEAKVPSQKEAEEQEDEPKPAPDGDTIHSSSVTMGSERLGAIAKMDLVDITLDESGSAASVCPVDYKVGSPREGEEGSELWDTDRMQLGLQCLILRDNGYHCDQGIIYYRGNKKRVPLLLTPELEAWVIAQIAAARVCAAGPKPPPLCDSPKCVRCSLAPVCLPDETRMLSIPTVEKVPLGTDEPGTCGVEVSSPTAEASPAPAPRRLIALRDEKRALYLTTQGYRVGCNDAVIKVKEKDRVVEEVRVMDVCHVAVFGNIQVSTQAVQRLCDMDIPITWFSMGGWFYGMTRGHSMRNVLLRIEQFRHAADPAMCLRLAQQFVRGKIHNHRVLFMRNHETPPERTKLRLGQARTDALGTRSLEELLGVEGAAAGEYFAQFNGMLRQREDDDFLEGLASAAPTNGDTVAQFRFDFTTRNRRPPTDPVNALLSLAYSLLAKECTLAAYAVGLDPYIGFYHQPRHGRPALALDIMEEFRALIAESAVLTAINNRYVSPADFVCAGRAVNLSAAGRKQFFQCFEQRMNSLITHPVFDYQVSYRRAVELQFRILARVLTGEIPEYVPFMNR